jgi:hypothetical protein
LCSEARRRQRAGQRGGVGSGGTGVFAAGPITGFGSIVVNDVRYDESAATVVDDDDANRTRAELKLGVTVTIDADPISTDASGRAAVARSVRLVGEIVGPDSAVDAAAGTLSVLGPTVGIGVDTVFDEQLAGGLAGIAAGVTLEVYTLWKKKGRVALRPPALRHRQLR